MKRCWTVHRRLEPHLDGTQRWDRAYQLVFQWAMTLEQNSTTPQAPSSPARQEADHADSHLRPGIDPTSN